MSKLKITMISTLAVGSMLLAGFLMGNWGLLMKEYFGVRNADIDRKIYEENQSHVEGTIQHLTRLRLDYELAESENQKAAIRRMLITEATAFGIGRLPQELQNFINQL